MISHGAVICPTVTASTTSQYSSQIKQIAGFAQRIHIDLADGVFTNNKLISLEKVWWPVGVKADIHLMYEAVVPFMEQLLKHRPNMVIVHAEAVGNFYTLSRRLKKFGIKTGVALLQDTSVKTIVPAIDDIDHVLVFSGDLGHFGGHANLNLLAKVQTIRGLRPDIEIGWDGGINLENAKQLVSSGVSVLNVGGYIQHAANAKNAYTKLVKEIS